MTTDTVTNALEASSLQGVDIPRKQEPSDGRRKRRGLVGVGGKAGRRFVDLREMPNWNPTVTNGSDSITRGVVYAKVLWGVPFPYHVKYGALLKVTPEGIWRCPASNEGCWEIRDGGGAEPVADNGTRETKNGAQGYIVGFSDAGRKDSQQ